jgi:hypothetical protein
MKENKMTTFKQYITDGIGEINEAGISRVLKTLEDGVDFAIITAFRGSKTTKENLKDNNQLIKDIRGELGQKVGAYKIVGHWKECSEPLEDGETIKDCKGKIVNALEESWLIPKPQNIETQRFENVIQKAARKYDQDGYVIRKNGKLTVNGKDGTVWDDLGKADKKSISTGYQRILDQQGYSELKKDRVKGKSRNIIFENFRIAVVNPKDSNISRTLFKKGGFLY